MPERIGFPFVFSASILARWNWRVPDKGRQKVIVVMPAHNAAKTLRITYEAMPMENIDHVILVDDGSHDETLKIAKELKLEVFFTRETSATGRTRKPATLRR